MESLVSMNLLFILWAPNGIKYKKINLIFWIIILSYYLDKNSTPKVLNPQISTFRKKKISPKILYALMKTINDFQSNTKEKGIVEKVRLQEKNERIGG